MEHARIDGISCVQGDVLSYLACKNIAMSICALSPSRSLNIEKRVINGLFEWPCSYSAQYLSPQST